MTGEVIPLGPIEHLLDKATLQNPGDLETLHNTWIQTEGSSENEEIKKYVPNERTEQNSRKITPLSGCEQAARYRVQNSGYKNTQELSENLNIMKKGHGSHF